MTIGELRAWKAKPSGFKLEKKLADGSNFRREIVSYVSEGLKVYGLLTVPKTGKPSGGFPAIVFVHGYIPPASYSTEKSYALYQDIPARSGFITFKPDLRGHGTSEGSGSAHFSDAFTVDAIEAIESLALHPEVDPDRIGYWGHSNGGEIGLRVIVAMARVKAASFWAGVVGSYPDMLETWNAKIRFMRVPNAMTEAHGLPSANPAYWESVDPHKHLKLVRCPVELQHARGDSSVPVELSRSLERSLKATGKEVAYHEYPGDNHNINANFKIAWERTIAFFKKHL